MEGELVFVSVISSIFFLVGIQLINHNWFKKERFKLETSNLKKQNDLQIKKMARDLGLSNVKGSPPETSSPNPFMKILPEIVKNMDPEQLGDIVDRFLPKGEEGEGSGGGFNDIVEYITQNPDILKGFIGGLSGGKKGEGGGSAQV